eukprot:6454274-Alexandrium_andersonii.AAC.1
MSPEPPPNDARGPTRGPVPTVPPPGGPEPNPGAPACAGMGLPARLPGPEAPPPLLAPCPAPTPPGAPRERES